MADSDALYLKKRRILAIVSLVVVIALAGWLTWWLTRWFSTFEGEPEKFKAFVDSYGWTGRFVALGIQILQVLVSLIPGEVVEIGLGYAYGALEGTLICMAGVALASALIFILVKRLGIRMVELFISREKIDHLRFINSEKKLKRTVFLLYFIPGTPKDLFTYFIGLTRIQLHEFLVISLIARIPSVVASTIGGTMLQKESYWQAAILFIVTGGISLLGIWIYNRIITRKNRKKAEKEAKS